MSTKFTERVNVLFGQLQSESHWQKKELKRNEFLKTEGSVDTNIYYILSGCLKIYTYIGDTEYTIRFGYKDNLIAALDSFLTGKASDMCIQAIRQTKVMVMKKQVFDQYMLENQDALLRWNGILGHAILDLMEREQDLLISSPAERFNRVLTRSPQLFQEVPNKYIASYLHMTPETLSRLKKKLE